MVTPLSPSGAVRYAPPAQPRCGSATAVPLAGPPTVSVLPAGPVRVKVGKDVILECISTGEPRSSARWTRVGLPAKVEPRTFGLMESHAVLKVRPGRAILV